MKKLEDIIEEYNELRDSFKNFISRDYTNKDSLLEYQSRFVDLRAELRPWHSKISKEYTRRDDKACTGIKFRIAVAMVRGEYAWDDEKPMYDKLPSISTAEKYASATQKYKKFLDERAFYKESVANINDLREDMLSYINLIKDKLK